MQSFSFFNWIPGSEFCWKWASYWHVSSANNDSFTTLFSFTAQHIEVSRYVYSPPVLARDSRVVCAFEYVAKLGVCGTGVDHNWTQRHIHTRKLKGFRAQSWVTECDGQYCWIVQRVPDILLAQAKNVRSKINPRYSLGTGLIWISV